jgi:hypothetical protein
MANTVRIKRRTVGASGSPSSLANAELAYNEVDDILYYGKGTGGAGGTATTIPAIGGPGAYATLATAQTVSGNKTFTGSVDLTGSTATAATPLTADSSTKIATTAFVKAQSYLTGNQNISFTGDASGSGTTSVTLTLASVGTSGTYTKVTTDAKGRVTSGTTLSASDIPSLTASKISDFDTQVRTNRLDQLAVPTAPVSFNSQRITDVATPVLSTDAVNKGYADSISQSLNLHGSVNYATTGSVAYTYTSGGTALTITTITGTDTITFGANHGLNLNSQVRTGDTTTGTGLTANTTYYVTAIPATNQVKLSSVFGGANATLTNGTGLNIGVTGDPGVGATLSGCPNTIDSGSTLTLGQRILVKDHTTAAYNGAYSVTTVGTGANGVWTRGTDFDNGPTGEISGGDYVFVASGTVNGGNGFVQTIASPVRMGKAGAGYTTFTGDSISFTQFSGAGQVTAGAGLTKTGNTLDAVGTSNRITVNADSIDIASTYVGQTSITTLGTIGTGTWNGTVISPTYGGTGVNNGSRSITLGGNLTFSGAFATTVAVTGTTSVTLPTSGTLISNTVTTLSSLVSVGTITTGTWNASAIGVAYGGTGATTLTGILKGNGTSAFTAAVDGTDYLSPSATIDGGTF